MKLIADAGGTNVRWCLVGEDGSRHDFVTTGMNPLLLSKEEMIERIDDELLPSIAKTGCDVDEVIYYGAGCAVEDLINAVRQALRKCFPGAAVTVESDMLGAARALLGHKAGVACILGTGSNSCYYDGEKIAQQVPTLGYILGDEGSGAVLGRQLIGDVFKNQLPDELCLRFREKYDLNLAKVIEKVYGGHEANRFMASLTPFLAEYIEEPAIHRLVLNSFKAFIVRNVAHYPGYRENPISFVGSIAYHFKEVLKEAADAIDCTVGEIIESPIDGLVEFHLNAK